MLKNYQLLLFIGLQLLIVGTGHSLTCKSVFHSFDSETQTVLTYLDQPISKYKQSLLKKTWNSIDTKINKNKSILSKKNMMALLKLRTSSSHTLKGFDGERNQQIALKNFSTASKFILKSLDSTDVTIDFIKTVNSIHRTGKESPADFRSADATLGTQSLYKVISPKDIEASMEQLITWYQTNDGKMHPIELAARFYQKLISIHPFEDANGRTTRDIMDFILMKHGYPPAVFDGRTVFASAVVFGLINPPKGYPQSQTPVTPVEALTEAIKNSIELLIENNS